MGALGSLLRTACARRRKIRGFSTALRPLFRLRSGRNDRLFYGRLRRSTALCIKRRLLDGLHEVFAYRSAPCPLRNAGIENPGRRVKHPPYPGTRLRSSLAPLLITPGFPIVPPLAVRTMPRHRRLVKLPPLRSPFLLLAAFMIGAGRLRAQAAELGGGVFGVESVTEIDAGMIASAPRWSPDGKWIAFSAPKGNGIGIVRADGSERRVLTAEPGSGYKFAWSPDASHIVFRAARKDAGPRQYVIRTIEVATGEIEASSEIVRDAQPPVWQRGPAGMRWVSHAATGVCAGAWRSTPMLTARVGPPLLIAHSHGLFVAATDAVSSVRDLGLGAVALNSVWSRDGKHVAFDSDDLVSVVRPLQAGSARTLCTGNHPAWSPDGKWIVFQITRDHTHAPDDPRQHTPDTLPHLHDDKTNHRIVDSDLWIIGADGTGRHQLTNTPDVMETEPDWSPDGAAIVCGTEETGRLLILKIGRR